MDDRKVGLPIILLAAIVQGWALYGLHEAIQGHHWPATQPTWLIALYALVVFVPVTLQILAERAVRRPVAACRDTGRCLFVFWLASRLGISRTARAAG